MDAEDLQLSLLQSALKVSEDEAGGSLLSGGWQVLGKIPPEVQEDIHALIPLLALVLFMLVVWIFLMILRDIPAHVYGEDAEGEKKGPRASKERSPDESPPVDSSPVCASLTFPRSEARFKIFAEFVRNGKRMDILGANSGRALLVAAVGVTKEGLSAIRISYPNCETDPRCSIQVAPEAIGYDAYVLGRKDEFYGTLERSAGACLVRHHEVLTLTAEVNQITLVAVVTSPKGRQVARGSMEGDGFFHLQVEPKADALLILATILAAVRLWHPAPSAVRRLAASGTVASSAAMSSTAMSSTAMSSTAM